MVIKEVNNYKLKTVSNAEMNELTSMIETGIEKADPERIKVYFHSWVLKHGDGQTLIYYFPKERYFVNRNGEENYIVALLQYIGYLKC